MFYKKFVILNLFIMHILLIFNDLNEIHWLEMIYIANVRFLGIWFLFAIDYTSHHNMYDDKNAINTIHYFHTNIYPQFFLRNFLVFWGMLAQ